MRNTGSVLLGGSVWLTNPVRGEMSLRSAAIGDSSSTLPAVNDAVFTFGSFRLIPAEQMVLDDGKSLRLGSRALDILIALVERAGETVLKDQLISRVWPDTIVDEGALRVHVAALRKALGDGRGGNRFIANIPGRGYSFVAQVTCEQRQEMTAAPDRVVVGGNLPASLTRVIGRADIVETVVSRVAQRRFLTIVGPGGVGKTTVALAAAEAISTSYADGVWFAGLASLVDATLLPSAVGAALGMAPTNVDPLIALPAWLRDKRMLIVLDSCEHVAATAAAMAEAVLRAAPRVCILATSREPLRAEGEWLLRLPSLEVPSGSAPLTAAEALSYPAVQLFNERAMATIDSFVLADADVPAVLEICRRLDGMPLALELAAAQVDVFGVRGLATRLDDRLAVLTKGRRTALPRQQTLRAAMDWSHDLLPEFEQVILRRLAVFQGDFTMDAATAVAAGEPITALDVSEGVANLVAKSLVATDISGDVTHHRLLDTTRAYALEKLTASGELECERKRHAEYYRDFFERVEAPWDARPTADGLAGYRHHIDNLRAALDWACSPSAEMTLGIALTVAAVPPLMQLSLVEECRGRVEQALASLAAASLSDARREMQLHAALGASLLFTRGPMLETELAWTRALASAEDLGDIEYQLRALWGLWVHRMNSGEFGVALALAQRFQKLAENQADPVDLPIADRMIGVSFHYRGDQTEARHHIESMLARYVAQAQRPPSVRYLFDQKVVARVILARISWLQGFPDQAWRAAQGTVGEAEALDHPITLCFALAEAACPIALFNGDLASAERYVAMLLASSAAHALPIWQSWGNRFHGTLLVRQGDFTNGLRLLRSSLDQPPEASFQPRFTWFLGQLADGSGRAGQIAEGLAAVDEALARSERNEDRWCLPELLRIKGDLLTQCDPVDEAAVEEHFTQSLGWARRQQTLSWELRAATTLARLWRNQHQVAEARELLGSVYDRFTEGFGTADLREAKDLLDQLE